MSNPYAASGTGFDAPGPADAGTRVVALGGRVGRLRLIAYGGVLMLLLFGGSGLSVALRRMAGANVALVPEIVLYVFFLGGQLVLARRRLQDLDHRAWVTSFMLIPGVNLLLGLYLAFAPGTRGSNTYGPEPAANGLGVKLTALLTTFLLVLLVASMILFYLRLSSAGFTGRH